MKNIMGRHIRHDFATWNDKQSQKSIRTLCGVTSKPALCGIPVVTNQGAWLRNNETGLLVFSWCWKCSQLFLAATVFEDISHAPHQIVELYNAAERLFNVQVRRGIQDNVMKGLSGLILPTIDPNSAPPKL